MIQVKRLGVLSLGKVMGLLYALLGLLIGFIFSCVSVIGSVAAISELGGEGLGFLFGIGSIIIFPIFYGVIGFVAGLLVAALYNLIARFVGGIEIYTE